MGLIKEIKINTEYITLQQLLKIADFINSGGEAKFFLGENEVLVNNEVESRRGRKLYKDDLIIIKGASYKIC